MYTQKLKSKMFIVACFFVMIITVLTAVHVVNAKTVTINGYELTVNITSNKKSATYRIYKSNTTPYGTGYANVYSVLAGGYSYRESVSGYAAPQSGYWSARLDKSLPESITRAWLVGPGGITVVTP